MPGDPAVNEGPGGAGGPAEPASTLTSRLAHKVKEDKEPEKASLGSRQFSSVLADRTDRPTCGSSTRAALWNRLGNLENF